MAIEFRMTPLLEGRDMRRIMKAEENIMVPSVLQGVAMKIIWLVDYIRTLMMVFPCRKVFEIEIFLIFRAGGSGVLTAASMIFQGGLEASSIHSCVNKMVN
uniref:Uncharacterized protein n=1 Tax=Opuntia streptacantha TaxID=393608 RepID=A0A7C9E848_OPUST